MKILSKMYLWTRKITLTLEIIRIWIIRIRKMKKKTLTVEQVR